MQRAKPATELELDLGRYELRRSGHRVKLERKPMELLIFLVSRRDQLVSRMDIVSKLWKSDLFIDTGPNINNIIRKIRTALRDNPDKPRFLETVVGKGYRFIGPVRVIGARYASYSSDQEMTHDLRMESTGVREERPSLAVMPLVRLGKNTDELGLSLGFADAMVARLANLQGIDVLPTSAVLNVAPEAPATAIAPRLGVRFLVHGAIQSLKGQWYLSMEMFDAYLGSTCCSRKCGLEPAQLPEIADDIAAQIARTLKRPLRAPVAKSSRHSRDQMAYAEFMRGLRLSSYRDPARMDEAAEHLNNAIARDPGFALAHATLSQLSAARYFEVDPARVWLENAEFHCRRALEEDPNLPEAHVANAFLLWGPSKNFQHVEAIAGLKRALALQTNLPHAYNRLGTILAHIGLLDRAREMYERGRAFHPAKAISHSVVQVHMWNCDYELAREEITAWRAEDPENKYPAYFAPQVAMMTGNWDEAKKLLEEALRFMPEEPLILSLQGVFYALIGKSERALRSVTRACAIPKSFGHAHHTAYQVACILSILGRTEPAFEWLERSVTTGFACWPFFLKDPCLKNLRSRPEFEVLVSSLQARYPDHLGTL